MTPQNFVTLPREVVVQERKEFEQWYSTHAFNYTRDPIGSRDCSIQWAAWIARRALTEQVQPAQGEPAKLWCETCEGSGQVYEESQAGIPGSGGNRKCPDCSGDGYITSTVLRTALLQSNAERVPLSAEQYYQLGQDHCLSSAKVEALHRAIEVEIAKGQQ